MDQTVTDLDQMIRVLEEKIEAAGGRGFVQRKLGRSSSYLRRTVSRSMRHHKILEILEAVGVAPWEFFREVYPSPDESEDWPVLCRGMLEGEDPKPEVSGLLEEVANAVECAGIPTDEGKVEAAADVLRSVEVLDELRYSDPGRASRRALALLEEVVRLDCHALRRARVAARVVGVLGSSLRMAGEQRAAGFVLWNGLRLVGRGAAARSDLLQRSGYVLGGLGKYREALVVVSIAMEGYLRIGNMVSVGKCLVDKGLFLFADGQYKSAEVAYRQSLPLLPSILKRSRGAALNGLAMVYERLGDAGEAKRYLALADEEIRQGREHEKGFLSWSKGQIAEKSGDLEEATAFYLEARDLLSTVNPIDTVMVGLDAARVLNQRGELGRARVTCLEMGELVEALAEVSKAAGAALVGLLVELSRGEKLQLALLEQTRRRVEAVKSLLCAS